ncbi:MAG TPA: hypothetical protein VLY63_17415 [Anaerolineae bacterium]|nr:hypothetical protein [Anaerolineae bacterium]
MKKVTVVLALVAVLSLVLASVVGAAGSPPPALSSGFQLQNRSATDPASISISYYDASGNEVEVDADTIAAKASKSYYVPNVLGQPDGRYSVVIESDQQLFALSNEVTATGATPNVAATHSGFTDEDIGSPLYIPWVVCEYYSYNSMFAVQNAGGGQTNITVEFYKSGNSSVFKSYAFNNVKPGGAVFLDMTQSPYNTDLNGFFGSVKAYSSDGTPLAAALNDTNPAGSFLRSYNAVKDSWAALKLYAPQVTANYYGFSTGITLQNPNSSSSTATVKYYATGATTPVATQNVTVAANSALPIYIPSVAGIPANFNGTAVIEVTNGVTIMGIANHDHVPAGPAASYNLVPESKAATQVFMPQVVRAYYGFESGWQVFNLGPDAVTVTATYYNADGSVRGSATHSVAANAAFSLYLGGAGGSILGTNFNGGGVLEVTGGNGKLVGIANFVSPNPGDYQQVYNSFYP